MLIFVPVTVSRNISKEREDALGALIDDASPSVQDALLAEFRRLGEPGLHILRRIAVSGEKSRSGAARIMLEELELDSPVQEMKDFIANDIGNFKRGVMIISSAAISSEDAELFSSTIEAIKSRVRRLVSKNSSSLVVCKAINRVLFHEYGLRGLKSGPGDLAELVPAAVLRRHRGQQLPLCILYMLIGWDLVPGISVVDMPGRPLVFCPLDGERQVYIDPYERGAIREPAYIHQVLEENSIEPDPAWFNPIGSIRAMQHLCHILAVFLEKARRPARARMLEEFSLAFKAVADADDEGGPF
jgi:regulator of sirC expression with transglutaminase-like and TPR domain